MIWAVAKKTVLLLLHKRRKTRHAMSGGWFLLWDCFSHQHDFCILLTSFLFNPVLLFDVFLLLGLVQCLSFFLFMLLGLVQCCRKCWCHRKCLLVVNVRATMTFFVHQQFATKTEKLSGFSHVCKLSENPPVQDSTFFKLQKPSQHTSKTPVMICQHSSLAVCTTPGDLTSFFHKLCSLFSTDMH